MYVHIYIFLSFLSRCHSVGPFFESITAEEVIFVIDFEVGVGVGWIWLAKKRFLFAGAYNRGSKRYIYIIYMYIYPGSPFGPNGLPLGRIGNPCSMDHPKDQPLCLVLDFQGIYIYIYERPPKPPTIRNSYTRTLILDAIMKLSGTMSHSHVYIYMGRYLQLLQGLGFYPLHSQINELRICFWVRCWNWWDSQTHVIQPGLSFYTAIVSYVFLPHVFFRYTWEQRKIAYYQLKRKKRFPTTKQDGPCGIFPTHRSRSCVVTASCDHQPRQQGSLFIPPITGSVLGRKASHRIRWNPTCTQLFSC